MQDEIPEQIDINQLISNVTSELNSLKPRIEKIYAVLGDITQEKNEIRKVFLYILNIMNRNWEVLPIVYLF